MVKILYLPISSLIFCKVYYFFYLLMMMIVLVSMWLILNRFIGMILFYKGKKIDKRFFSVGYFQGHSDKINYGSWSCLRVLMKWIGINNHQREDVRFIIKGMKAMKLVISY